MKPEKYLEAFNIEIDAWCYGITQYPGEIYPSLVHAILKELTPTLAWALEHGVVFNLVEVSEKISKAAKYLVHHKEVAFSLLARFPAPHELKTEDEMYTLAAILDMVEKTHQGAIERMEKRWANLSKAA
ncbi:MAG: hypothetical protein KDD53_07580 [Bdellovibrionales bacterium]|nr:hypothetical protein [Bdellovibrionales bacterium]